MAEPRQTHRAVFIPPLAGHFFQRFAPRLNVWVLVMASNGGVLLVEADKILYAASGRDVNPITNYGTPPVGQTRDALSPKV